MYSYIYIYIYIYVYIDVYLSKIHIWPQPPGALRSALNNTDFTMMIIIITMLVVILVIIVVIKLIISTCKQDRYSFTISV